MSSRRTTRPRSRMLAAMGIEMTQTLVTGENTLLIEGPSDLIYLDILSDAAEAAGRTGLDLSGSRRVGLNGAENVAGQALPRLRSCEPVLHPARMATPTHPGTSPEQPSGHGCESRVGDARERGQLGHGGVKRPHRELTSRTPCAPSELRLLRVLGVHLELHVGRYLDSNLRARTAANHSWVGRTARCPLFTGPFRAAPAEPDMPVSEHPALQ